MIRAVREFKTNGYVADRAPTADRLPPQNLDAERCVLGSMLRDNEVIDEVAMALTADSFYLDAHQKIFRAILGLRNKSGQAVDLVLLHEDLSNRGQLEDVGRAAYLAKLWDAAPTAANVGYYARIVREKGILRSLIRASTEIMRDAYDQGQPAEDLLAKAEREIFSVSELGVEGQTYEFKELVPEMLRHLDELSQGKRSSGLSTGHVDLDELTTGFHEGELIIIGARPSGGKTAMGLDLANNARKQGEQVFFVSLEQTRQELTMRLMCMEARVNSHFLRSGRFSRDDSCKIVDAVPASKIGGLHIDDLARQSMVRIAAQARRLKRKHGLSLIVVDYVQLIEPEDRSQPRYEQIGQSTRRLKQLAKELRVPVIALAQVGRDAEERKRPRLSDLRESGNIECDADTVFLLHRNEEQHPGVVEVIVAKQRNGPTGDVMLAFLKQFMKFENYVAGTPYDSDIPN